MKEAVSILLDKSLDSQKKLLSKCTTVHNIENIGKNIRYWCKKSDLSRINIPIDIENKIIFYGSSDFHHLTYNLLRKIKKPTTLLLLDKHTECISFFREWIYCGSWIYDVIKLSSIKKVIIVGVDEDIQKAFITDLLNPLLLPVFTNLDSLSHKVKIFPYLPYNKKFLNKNIQKKLARIITPPFDDINKLLLGILENIKTDDVYISIDKDVLTEEYSVTNWGNGRMSLDSLIKFIEGLSHKKKIMAFDICGDISYDKPNGFFRKLHFYVKMISKSSNNQQINEKTNMILMEHLKKL